MHGCTVSAPEASIKCVPRPWGVCHARLRRRRSKLSGSAPTPDLGAPRRAVFTYGGQVNWMRYILSMRTPSKFPLAVTAVSGIMTAAYVGIGAVGCSAAADP